MCKRLFSLLVVLATMLTMLPVVQFSTAAVGVEMSGVRFPSDVTSYEAECSVCKKTVTWKPYNGENYSDSNPLTASVTSTHFHLYLTKDQIVASGKYFLVCYRSVCFNLNGYNITASEGSLSVFAVARKFNVIDTYGGSVVIGYRGSATAGAAIHANSVNADYHLYGGTWTKNPEDVESPVIRLHTKGGSISVHDGAVVVAPETSASSAVDVGGSIAASGAAQKAAFHMLGGQIKGRIDVGAEGSTYTGCASVTMYAGILTGDVAVKNGAALMVEGGTITGKVSAASGTTIALGGNAKIQGGLAMADDVTADIAELTEDAKIVFAAFQNNRKLTTAREDANMLAGVFSSADGAAILLGTDNCYYVFSDGVAILSKDNQAVIYDTADAATAEYFAKNGFANGDLLLAGTAGQTINLSGDAYVDAAGKNITVNGNGRLYGIDSGNDDYKTCARWFLGEDVIAQPDVINPATGNRYLAVREGETLGYHRMDLALSQVVLRPNEDPGMYYKARIACDETLAKYVTGYGVALSLEAMPGADFAEQEDVRYTIFDSADFAAKYEDHQVLTISCVLVGILKTENSNQTNTINIRRQVYANPYVNLSIAGQTIKLMADNKNIGKTVSDKKFNGVAVSMQQLLAAIGKKWSTYSKQNRQTVQDFLVKWGANVTEGTFPTMGGGIQVGFGRADITPDYSVPLAGYGNTHNRMSTSVQTRIYVTCLALTDQYDQTLLVVSMDLINAVWHEEIRAAISAATGVPTSHIAVSATHTHAAPDPDSTLDVIQKTYKPQFMLWAAEAAAAAMADRAEAFVFSGDTRLEKMNTVRHYLMADGTYAGDNFGTFTNNTIVAPAEKADNQLQVVKFTREDKKDVVMANWQAHPTLSTGSKYYKISADIIAPTRDYVEKNTDSLFVYFSGASGNINPESKIKTENITEDYWLYGELLGQAVTGVLGDMDEADITMVKAQTITFTGEIDHTGEEKLAQATEVRELYMADGLSAANKLARKYGFSNYYHAYGIVRRSKYGATRDFEISVFTLGGISFVIAPSEMFSSHGEYIKENTPGVTFVLTSANGKVNYIPNTKAYDYSCYERHAGYFTRETGDILAQTYVDMLNRLTN